MMKTLFRCMLCVPILTTFVQRSNAQCLPGQDSVVIAVTTDTYAYESYWQLVPHGDACGTNAIFAGGNALVGCAGGGLQLQQPGGYGNNITINEGPFCLTDGAQYDIIAVDDWGDSGPSYNVIVSGIPSVQFTSSGASQTFTFTVALPPARDLGVTWLTTSLYAHATEPLSITGSIKNTGAETVTTFNLAYTVDGGAPVVATIAPVSIAPGQTYEFVDPTPFIPPVPGNHAIMVWAQTVNGGTDLNPANDAMTSHHIISPAVPDLTDLYLAVPPVMNTIANSDQDLLVPRDLDFHPDASRNEVWVINKDVESTGGSTVTFYHAGEPDMTFQYRHDPNAWHFMSLPTGIAMGDNNCFSTCPGVFDANHNGGDPFTGPTLWSADTAIYAGTIYGGLGSHLDMLHVDPNSQGIAHDHWNRYWVVDGFNHDIVMNDFRKDHGPGNDYHGDAIIRRYAEFTITRDPNDNVVSHDVMDKRNGWLYVVDFGGQRVLRMNTNTGTVSGPGNYGPWESYAEYSMVTGYTWEAIVTSGLIEPAGIDIIGDHLYVSDHANGDIVIYNVSGAIVPEIGRIHTGSPGIMGIRFGPDGKLWYVNATSHSLVRIDEQTEIGIATQAAPAIACYPNPANDRLFVQLPACSPGSSEYAIHDVAGRLIESGSLNANGGWISTSHLTNGAYSMEIRAARTNGSLKFVVAH